MENVMSWFNIDFEIKSDNNIDKTLL
ncbi:MULTISPECIES: hypothetical protein [Bacilli]|uniref:SPbeta prophage-derived uncharacterized protein YotF n=4 Tax=root TaxID=1 RepID=YOTF_BACSU|nr:MULTISPECIES: hypothetical protein [Bacillales]NP_046729.1 hypothetical protein SPBc2p177 [Bacillus phage SPBc2]NP_389871.1 hypothetical protein; phage SPbeta [Bacillus subtilis subsp. subtilis str. 168]O31869.1 RecName: Full=SPbeta prophage-derived uncharacterized protein YotF [Bacillus subtilis subsp. subtilis str. 168]APD21334.1 hypothetical protein phi3T_191 [Bacillus phage phi3T]AAC13150.1 hypothetical protein [Bacillus phage SPBc2]AFQ57934.1 YotF [Bacillus subtilis QB928]AGG61380.1 